MPDDDTCLCRVPDPAPPVIKPIGTSLIGPVTNWPVVKEEPGRAGLAPPPPPSPSPPPPKIAPPAPLRASGCGGGLGCNAGDGFVDNYYAYAYEDHEAVMSACTCPVDHPICNPASGRCQTSKSDMQSYSTGNSACEVENAGRCMRNYGLTNGASDHVEDFIRAGTVVEMAGDCIEGDCTLENSAGANLVSCQYKCEATCASPSKDSLILDDRTAPKRPTTTTPTRSSRRRSS